MSSVYIIVLTLIINDYALTNVPEGVQAIFNAHGSQFFKSFIFWDITPCSSFKVKQTTQHYIPEGRTHHNHCHESLKSYNYL
jgi:hypothetical protein